MQIQQILFKWYESNHRKLPWRETQNPYLVWLSEVILQQTRVEQGLPYYLKFVNAYPTVTDLANASLDEVLKNWQGLGYYSRARNMHATARFIKDNLNGKFPESSQELLKLKGIGKYTAAAIASFCYNEAIPVIDGNVYRVLARFFGLFEPINSHSSQKAFNLAANELLHKTYPGKHNQAMMELGATVCKPSGYTCNICPLNLACFAYANNKQSDLPVKKSKVKPGILHHYYAVIIYKQKTYIYQRNENQIWAKLFEPPLISSDKPLTKEELIDNWSAKFRFKPNYAEINLAYETKHLLTHRTIYAHFYVFRLNQKPLPAPDFLEVNIDQLHDFATHRLFEKFLSNINLQQNKR